MKPKKPKEPIAPTSPMPPEPKRLMERVFTSNHNRFSLADLAKVIPDGVHPNDVFVCVDTSTHSCVDGYYGDVTTFESLYVEVVKAVGHVDPSEQRLYERQRQRFLNDKAAYDIQMKMYNDTLVRYNESMKVWTRERELLELETLRKRVATLEKRVTDEKA